MANDVNIYCLPSKGKESHSSCHFLAPFPRRVRKRADSSLLSIFSSMSQQKKRWQTLFMVVGIVVSTLLMAGLVEKHAKKEATFPYILAQGTLFLLEVLLILYMLCNIDTQLDMSRHSAAWIVGCLKAYVVCCALLVGDILERHPNLMKKEVGFLDIFLLSLVLAVAAPILIVLIWLFLCQIRLIFCFSWRPTFAFLQIFHPLWRQRFALLYSMPWKRRVHVPPETLWEVAAFLPRRQQHCRLHLTNRLFAQRILGHQKWEEVCWAVANRERTVIYECPKYIIVHQNGRMEKIASAAYDKLPKAKEYFC